MKAFQDDKATTTHQQASNCRELQPVACTSLRNSSAAARHNHQILGIENTIEDADDAPIPPGQVAAAYEAIDDVNYAVKNCLQIFEDDDAPIPMVQIDAMQERKGNDRSSPKKTTTPPEVSMATDQFTYRREAVLQSPTARANQEHPMEQSLGSQQITTTFPAVSESQTSSDIQRESRPNDQDQVVIMMPPTPNPISSDPNPGEQSQQGFPVLEATLVQDESEEQVVYDAVAVRQTLGNETPPTNWCKRHEKYICVGLASLLFGALAATIVSLVGSRSNEKSNSVQDTSQSPEPSTFLYYADREHKRCIDDPLGRPIAGFESIKECCDAEFQNLQGNECILNSLSSTSGGPTPTSFAGKPASTTTDPTLASTQPPTSIAWKQHGNTIMGKAANGWFGYSLALSGDGRSLAVGAPGDSEIGDRPGYASIYQVTTNNGTSWELRQAFDGLADGDLFGYDVSITIDSRTVSIGGPGSWQKGDRTGYVRVYHVEGDGATSSWKQSGQDINGEAIGDQAGSSVAISSSGKVVAIGSNNNDENGEASGHVRVISLEESGPGLSRWQQLGQDIDGEAEFDNSGGAVALSSDGKTVAIGASANDGAGDLSGHVRVYHFEEEDGLPNWKQLGQDIDGEWAADFFGHSVSVSGDGRTLAIGAPFNGGNSFASGHVRVFVLEGEGNESSWNQLGQGIDGNAGDWAGSSVSLSFDGQTVAVGCPGYDGNIDRPGYVRVYSMDGNDKSWIQLGQDIVGKKVSEHAGWSVSLSSDARVVAIGSPANGTGVVRVYSIEY